MSCPVANHTFDMCFWHKKKVSPTKASLIVRNGLPLNLFPSMEVVNSIGGCLHLFNLTIIHMINSCIYFHTSFIVPHSPDLLYTSLLVISPSFASHIAMLIILLIYLWWNNSIIARSPLLPLQSALPKKQDSLESHGTAQVS